jgi:hypothetical protein
MINDEFVDIKSNNDSNKNSNDNSNSRNFSKSLKELLTETYSEDNVIKKIMKTNSNEFRKLSERFRNNDMRLAMKDLKIRNKRFYYEFRLFVSNSNKLKLHLLKSHEEFSMQSHSQYKSMYVKLLKNYFWTAMKEDCRKYVINCVSCRRFKVYNNQKQRLLISLLISQRKWRNLSLDFVIELLKCHKQNRRYENILIIVDRLTKRRLYEFMTNIKTKIILKDLKRRIFLTYDLSNFLVHDRNSQFTTRLWRWICQRYEIKFKLFSAHHSETDDQIENANKIMKNYLRAYVKHAQNDWVNYLSETEFAINNHVNVFIKMTFFFVDHEYHFRSDVESLESIEKNAIDCAELLTANKYSIDRKRWRNDSQKFWFEHKLIRWDTQTLREHHIRIKR